MEWTYSHFRTPLRRIVALQRFSSSSSSFPSFALPPVPPACRRSTQDPAPVPHYCPRTPTQAPGIPPLRSGFQVVPLRGTSGRGATFRSPPLFGANFKPGVSEKWVESRNCFCVILLFFGKCRKVRRSRPNENREPEGHDARLAGGGRFLVARDRPTAKERLSPTLLVMPKCEESHLALLSFVALPFTTSEMAENFSGGENPTLLEGPSSMLFREALHGTPNIHQTRSTTRHHGGSWRTLEGTYVLAVPSIGGFS